MKIKASVKVVESMEYFEFTLQDIQNATDYSYLEKEWLELDIDEKNELIEKTVSFNMKEPTLIIDHRTLIKI